MNILDPILKVKVYKMYDKLSASEVLELLRMRDREIHKLREDLARLTSRIELAKEILVK